MNRLVVTVSLLAIALPLAAQAPPQHAHDDSRKAMTGGTLPAGWQARLDRAGDQLDAVNLAAMGSGFHATTGPAAIFFQPTTTARSTYQVEASFTEPKPSAEAYGLFIGGVDLLGPGQRYSYFLIRRDGKFLIKRRAGADTKTVIDWSANQGVKTADAKGKMTNVLAIAVGKDEVRFLANGTEVAKLPKAQLDTDGVIGLRINHDLDIHIDGFAVRPGTSE